MQTGWQKSLLQVFDERVGFLPHPQCVTKAEGAPYSTLPIFFTAATRRALSTSTNFANSGASM
jgi:hypothetical protein